MHKWEDDIKTDLGMLRILKEYGVCVLDTVMQLVYDMVQWRVSVKTVTDLPVS